MLIRRKLVALSMALAATALIAQALAAQDNRPSPEAKQRYSQARKLIALGEKEKAIEELKSVIRLAPEFVEAHRDFLDNQRDKAETFIEQYEGYVKENPDSAVYHYLLGKAYSNANKREKADAEFNKALELNPEFGWAMLAVSTMATRNRDSDRAAELLVKASKHAGDSIPLRLALGNSFNNKKMYEQAFQEAERILRIAPESFDAYTIKWQARMNITFGADETRDDVLGEVREIERRHGKDISALLVVQSGYQMLENDEGASKAREAILALDPKYYERQQFSLTMGTSSGKIIRLSGAPARLLSQTFSMKDEREKIETYKKVEKDIEDADAKLYGVYPGMLRSYIALKDLDNAGKMVEAMIKGNMDQRELAGHRVTLARAYVESKQHPDLALDHLQQSIKHLREPIPTKEGTSPEAAEYQKENARNQLASALHLQGQIFLQKGMAQQAADSLSESVQINASEESLIDLGLAYSALGRKNEATDALSRAYAYEGKRQQEARASLQKVYSSSSKPLADLLKDAVESHRAQMRESAISKALREIARVEPKQAPSFELMTLAGQKVRLADLRGKVLLLNFWATW
ncbi:MAG TPA: tetratricopeptide repeat protein [Blastocatellia bacterium]|nr:tetratricopeptide repeat protein [Blastocatellia bacterium]